MLIIGVGSRWRGDDGAAFEVIEQLRRDRVASTELIEAEDVLSLIDRWSDEDLVIVVDAVRSGAPAGTIHQIDVTEQPLPMTSSFASSHQVGVAHAIEIARAFDRLPRRLVVVGIEGAEFGFGNRLSPEVAAAVGAACRAVARYLPARVA